VESIALGSEPAADFGNDPDMPQNPLKAAAPPCFGRDPPSAGSLQYELDNFMIVTTTSGTASAPGERGLDAAGDEL
jgi:hypothetical protein